jgi:hypothetical protein
MGGFGLKKFFASLVAPGMKGIDAVEHLASCCHGKKKVESDPTHAGRREKAAKTLQRIF